VDTIWQNHRLLPKGLVLPDCLKFRQKVCEICSLWYPIYEVMNKILFVCDVNKEGIEDLAALVWGKTGQVTAGETEGDYGFTTSEKMKKRACVSFFCNLVVFDYFFEIF